MNKKKILDYWNSRAGNKILKCTNDINLENNEISATNNENIYFGIRDIKSFEKVIFSFKYFYFFK